MTGLFNAYMSRTYLSAITEKQKIRMRKGEKDVYLPIYLSITQSINQSIGSLKRAFYPLPICCMQHPTSSML